MATTYVKHCISLVLISVTFGTFFVGFPGLLVVKSRTSRVTDVFDNEYDHADNYLLVFGDSRDWHIWHDWCISGAGNVTHFCETHPETVKCSPSEKTNLLCLTKYP